MCVSLGQRTLGMLCPFVQTCSCARTRALSLIHTDLVNTDVKTAAGQHLNSVVFFSKENVYFFGDVLRQMEMRGDKFNPTKAHALIGTQIRIAA